MDFPCVSQMMYKYSPLDYINETFVVKYEKWNLYNNRPDQKWTKCITMNCSPMGLEPLSEGTAWIFFSFFFFRNIKKNSEMSTKNGKATVPTTKPMNKVMIFSRESALAPGFPARHAPPAVTRLQCVHFRIFISQIYRKSPLKPPLNRNQFLLWKI